MPCARCSHWWQTNFELEVGLCARYPAHIETPKSHWCGEYQNRSPDFDYIDRIHELVSNVARQQKRAIDAEKKLRALRKTKTKGAQQ